MLFSANTQRRKVDEFGIRETDWPLIGILRKVLLLPAEKTTLLQGNDITPGDFYHHWTELKHELKELEQKYASEAEAAGAAATAARAASDGGGNAGRNTGTVSQSHLTHASKLPGAILLSMLNRETVLFANPMLFAGVLADPRTYFFIAGDESKQYYHVRSNNAVYSQIIQGFFKLL